MKSTINKIINLGTAFGLTAITALCLPAPARAGYNPVPGQSSAFGKTLAAWEDIYTRWSWGDITVPADANGNAVVGANMVLFPVPSTLGDGSPAHTDVTLNHGQSFMLPLWAELGTSYDDGTPPDPFLPDSVFQTLEISFMIDGVAVVTGSNVMDYYSKFTFSPAIPLNFPPTPRSSGLKASASPTGRWLPVFTRLRCTQRIRSPPLA